MPILNSAYFTAWYDDMTSAFGKVCRIKNRHTFRILPILKSAYFTECRFVIRHITQTETQTETELLRRHGRDSPCRRLLRIYLVFYVPHIMTALWQFLQIRKLAMHHVLMGILFTDSNGETPNTKTHCLIQIKETLL